MKKIVVALTIVTAMLASCGNGKGTSNGVVDSTKVGSIVVDSAKVDSVKVDSVLVDSTKTKN